VSIDIEETLVLVKPDGVARGLTGQILARIEAKGYQLVDLRLVQPERDLLAQHYAEHEGKPFYEPLVEFMESGPVVAIRIAGNRVIEGFRSLRARPIPRRQPPAPSAAISAATGASVCSRISSTAVIRRSPRPASSPSGSPERYCLSVTTARARSARAVPITGRR
jgi:nucleoside-diphosphate kinase